MTFEEKIALLEETLEVEEGKLTPETRLDTLEEYDSMAKLALIVMYEDDFDRKIEGRQIKGFSTVQDLLNLME